MKIYKFIACLLLLGGLTSCMDDYLVKEEGTWSEDETGVIFQVGATRGGFDGSHTSMVSSDDEETVINPKNFRVVFFDSKGSVKEIWANQELAKLWENDPVLGRRATYFVKIPRHYIKPETIEMMRTERFKIAVFANWSDYPNLTADGSSPDPVNGIDRNFIYYISHCLEDASYESSSSGTDSGMTDAAALKFITGDGYMMGMAQEWVCDRFKDDADADAFVRENYKINDDGTGELLSNRKPEIENAVGTKVVYESMDPFTYHDVWQVWNFGGEKNYSSLDPTFYNSPSYEIRTKWAEINNDWAELAYDDESGTGKTIANGNTVRGLKVVTAGGTVQGVSYSDNGATRYGIKLNKSNYPADGKSKIEGNNGSYLHYNLPADGYLYVKCRAATPGAKLVARRGGLNTNSSIYAVAKDVTEDGLNSLTWGYNSTTDNQVIRVTGEPAELILYAIGGDVEIYEIDYIKSRMLQYTDRQMINPLSTPEGGISMYGIQDFEPAPLEVWPEGTTFNFSRFENTHTGEKANEYPYRKVNLLRSVSKVELYLPTSIFPDPSHIYLRTINRFSRSAPLDVFTPTNILWDGWAASASNYKVPDEFKDFPSAYEYTVTDVNHNDHLYYQAPGIDKEVEYIRQNGFMYEYNNTSLPDYKNAIAWLFGNWNAEYGWNWNGENISIRNNDATTFPRIFNTRISRSDYAHMLYGGIVEGCYYYYAYLPEKNITDPNEKGSLGESPKVMRIEMRFDGRNSDKNLDDNASYRIYFMPGGRGETTEANRDNYDTDYERGNGDNESLQMQNLHSMYPVVRNHIYRFNVTGIDMNKLKVNFEVEGPESRDINYTFE